MGFGDTVSGVWSEVVDFATGEDSDAAQRAADLTATHDSDEAVRAAREDIDRSRVGDVATGRSVVVPEAFDGMSHPEMFAYATELTPDLLDSGAVMWREAHTRMTTLVWALWNDLGSVLGTDWQGPAASSALSAVSDYRTRSLRTLDLMDIVAGKLEQSRDGFVLTRATMPPPQSFTPSDWARTAMTTAFLGPVGAAGSITSMMAEEEERRAEAVAVMNGTYVPTVVRADHAVPVLPPPADPVTGGDALAQASSAAAGFSAGGGASPGVGAAVGGVGAAPQAGYAGDGSPAATSAASTDGTPATIAPNAVTDRASPPPAGVGSGSATAPAATGPAGFGSGRLGSGGPVPRGRPGAPGSAGAGSISGGSNSGGAGSGGAGSAGTGPDGRGSGSDAAPLGSRGSSGIGAPGTGGSIMQSAGAGSSTRGAAYGPGAMMPGGRGGGDGEPHRTAGYLVTADNGDALVGDLPLVAPPVIG